MFEVLGPRSSSLDLGIRLYVVFDEESEFSGPRTSTLSLDHFFLEKRTPKNLKMLFVNLFFFFSLLVFF